MTTNLILFDDNRTNLQPLSFTRPVSELRIGILTIKEKWERLLDSKASYFTAIYLAKKFPCILGTSNLLINGSILPTKELCDYIINQLPPNTLLTKNGTSIAYKSNQEDAQDFLLGKYSPKQIDETNLDFIQITYPWDLFMNNSTALQADFDLLTDGRKSQILSSSNRLIGDSSQIFLEEGAWVEAATLNCEDGPIYIGKNATVMEGSLIRGAFALCEGAVTKMAAKIYGATTIGPYSKVGGEISNSIILGYSNKGHDGFLGNAVLGEWCNLGADTNSSNLKNNYGEVRVWNYKSNSFLPTGLQFCGLIMGDHSKTGINTMLNTGTVIGVSCNVFGADFPRKFIPSFSWGSYKGFETYSLKNAFETATRVMQRRHISFDDEEVAILKHIFEETTKYRNY